MKWRVLPCKKLDDISVLMLELCGFAVFAFKRPQPVYLAGKNIVSIFGLESKFLFFFSENFTFGNITVVPMRDRMAIFSLVQFVFRFTGKQIFN